MIELLAGTLNVGSLNEVKIGAVRSVAMTHPGLRGHLIKGFGTKSGVRDQPLSLEEIITGSRNRAKAAFEASATCYLGFGIESGIYPILYPETRTPQTYMDTCACTVWDGSGFSTGLSASWEVPSDVVELVLSEGLDLNQAWVRTGRTTNPKLGNFEGAVGQLTGGRVTRELYTMQAVEFALIRLSSKG